MSNSQGQFVWYELMTTDVAAAKEFYGKVVGWGSEDVVDARHGLHHLLPRRRGRSAGLMDAARRKPRRWERRRAGSATSPSTTSMPRQQRSKVSAGACTCRRRDIPNVGRFAVVADPQMAAFNLFKSMRARSTLSAPSSRHAGRDRLARAAMRPTGRKAFAFYSTLFGWTKDQAMDMGADGHLPALLAAAARRSAACSTSRRRSRRPSGSTTSTSRRSTRRPSGSRPAAARSSTVRWKCPAAAWHRPVHRTRRAPCSRWTSPR